MAICYAIFIKLKNTNRKKYLSKLGSILKPLFRRQYLNLLKEYFYHLIFLNVVIPKNYSNYNRLIFFSNLNLLLYFNNLNTTIMC